MIISYLDENQRRITFLDSFKYFDAMFIFLSLLLFLFHADKVSFDMRKNTFDMKKKSN